MIRRLQAVVAAAVAVAAVAAVVVPQHAASLALLAAGTVVVVLAVFLLVLAGPLVTGEHPATALDASPGTGAPGLDPQGLRDARRDLAGRAQASSLPPAIWERLVVAGVLRLQRRGIDIDNPRTRAEGEALLSAATWALLASPPRAGSAVDPARVASIVHRTLDELDRLAAPPGGAHDHAR